MMFPMILLNILDKEFLLRLKTKMLFVQLVLIEFKMSLEFEGIVFKSIVMHLVLESQPSVCSSCISQSRLVGRDDDDDDVMRKLLR